MAQKKITDLDLISSLTEDCNFPVDNSVQTFRATVAQMNTLLRSNFSNNANLMKNVGLSVTANTGAMTVALKQADGTTDPTSSDILKSEIAFRSPTLTSGAKVIVPFTAALSLVIPSGATFGYANGEDARSFVYAYYDGTNKGLACTPVLLDETQLYSLSAIGTGSDFEGLYADASRTGAAVRLIGEFQVSAISTAGTWTTPTYVSGLASTEVNKIWAKRESSGTNGTIPSGSAGNVTSKVIGAGIWKCRGQVSFNASGGAPNLLTVSVNTTSATHGTTGDNKILAALNSGGQGGAVVETQFTVAPGSTATVYLVAEASASGPHTSQGYKLTCERIAWF